MSDQYELFNDPYPHCEEGRCNHDVREGVLITDLLSGDGPHQPSWWGQGRLKAAIDDARSRREAA